MNRMRRVNAGSRLLGLLVARIERAAVRLEMLHHEASFPVRVAAGVVTSGALAEQGVRFVEKQERASLLGRAEQSAKVLLRLPDPLADKTGQVDAVQVHVQVVGHHFGGRRLVRVVLAREDRHHREALSAGLRQSRFAAGLGDVACVRREVSE